ncbi:hypothetical protein Avbf_02563 [Armadillidium vulgare]|nr:hypothetical protein Avbf_02563 [Armadillidium vulgare]
MLKKYLLKIPVKNLISEVRSNIIFFKDICCVYLIVYKRLDRCDSPLQKWQDKINSGFDKLVALASEVDKRRKSSENSPHHLGSSPSGGDRKPMMETFSPPISECSTNNSSSQGTLKTLKRSPSDECSQILRGGQGPIEPPLYSPHSPSLSSPLSLPNGRPPTPQSPSIPAMHTPPMSSPPPTPSPDHCRGISPHTGNHFTTDKVIDSPPYLHQELESTHLLLPPRLPSPSEQPLYDHHHFKKKFYHQKERYSPQKYDDHNHHNNNSHHHNQRYPNHNSNSHHNSSYGYHNNNNHHSSSHSHHGKFRPKGKDWHWRNSGGEGRRSPNHHHSYSNNSNNNNNNNSNHHSSHYQSSHHHNNHHRQVYPPSGPLRYQNHHHQLLTTAPNPSRQPSLGSHTSGYFSHNCNRQYNY